MIDLRCFTYIDVLQPQLASFIQTVSKGFQPLERMAALLIEVQPGMSINQVTDVILKATTVMPGLQVVERQYGALEVHDFDQGQIREGGRAALDYYGIEETDRLKPKILTEQTITGVDGHQAMLINRMRHGDFLLEGQTLYVMECHPAGYAAIAANEAEKAAEIHLLEVSFFGAFGRLYLGGYEAEIEEAARGVRDALAGLEGRPNDAS
ncbi:MAG: hypothetical protein AUK47_11260 [Deltaproteobacteria bacterium CG2_30_63_29]|nr:MAG: hypothetical protein AUK47_11260 [Deltaproteobacteria bacterium CG2_30_63_29]